MSRPSFSTEDQGTVVVDRDGDGFLMMLPDGSIEWQPTGAKIEKSARNWFKNNLQTDIGIGKIEWR